jgi:phosphoribosylformimino-5-aminoimidazole carboxamide ribonucleotide (ProFAR) isomerase
VPFETIPAIDTAGGRLVRLRAGMAVPVDAFGGDPLAAARAFVEAGARWLHVVDVDLAFDGVARNRGALTAIARLGVRVQASGGMETDAQIRAALDVGADRVVLGSGALAEPAVVSRLVSQHEDRVVVGIELRGGRISSRGPTPVDLGLEETLSWLEGTDVVRFLLTSVERTGELVGPDLDASRSIASLNRPWIVAGGIASIEDLREVAAAGAEGAVVGSAVLEGTLDLRAALALDLGHG